MALRPALGAFLLAAGYAQAAEPLAGDWKLALEHNLPCNLTIDENGAVTPGPDCTLGTSLARWKSTSTESSFRPRRARPMQF